jgi:uncharacterized coiled-coil protein SlyX
MTPVELRAFERLMDVMLKASKKQDKRLAELEQLAATHSNRLDAQQRHLKNLESELKKRGPAMA